MSTPEFEVHRAIVHSSNVTTGAAEVRIPSLLGAGQVVSIPTTGLTLTAGEWNVPSAGSSAFVAVSADRTQFLWLTGVTVPTDSDIDFTDNVTIGGDLTVDGDIDATHINSEFDGPVVISIKNTSGSTVAKGTPVYATGSVGQSGAVEVSPSRADTSGTMPALGLTQVELAHNGEGHAVVLGVIDQMDTSTYTINDSLYVAPTGGLTNTRPTGNNDLIQKIGRVVRVNQSTGEILVLGAGRTNDVPNVVVAGGLTIDTDTLHVDSTNDRVGIGTTSPSQPLDVDGNIKGTTLQAGSTYYGYPLSVEGTTTVSAFFRNTLGKAFLGLRGSGGSGNDKVGIGSDNGDGLELHAGDNPRLVIDSSGNVGIGTTSPNSVLEVAHAAEAKITLNDSGGTAGSSTNSVVEFQAGGSFAGYVGFNNVGDGTMRLQNDDGIVIVETLSADYFAVRTNGATHLTVTSDGNVGINDTTPSYKLDVAGDIRATGVIQTNTVRDNTGQQLVLEAGEATGKFSGQTGEFVYISSESGLSVYTPDGGHPNFQSGYVTRVSELNGEFLKIFDGPTLYQSTQNYGTFNVQGYTRGSYYGVLLDQDANFMMNTAHSAGGIYWDAVNTWMFYSTRGAQTRIHYNGSQKMETSSVGISVSGRTYMDAAAYGHSNCGGSPNNIAFRWVNPYIKSSVDNVVCATVGTVSDERFKKDIVSWNGGIDIVRQLRPVTYTPRDITAWGEVSMNPIEGFEDRETKHGLIAQEVQEVMPTAVDGGGTISGYLSLNEDELIAMLISATKNIDERLTALETV